MHWISGTAPTLPGRYAAKTRYRMPDATCSLRPIGFSEDAGAGRLRASFDAPQWAPTPGQYLVLYDGDTCLGGGVIEAPGTGMKMAETEAEVAGIGTPVAASAVAAEDLPQAK